MALNFENAKKLYLKNIVIDDDPNKSFIKEIKFRPEGASKDVTKYAVNLPMVGEDGTTTNRYQFYADRWQISKTSPKRVQIEFTAGDQISVRQINGKYAGKDGITKMSEAGLDPKNAADKKAYFVNVKKSPEDLIEEWKTSSANYRKTHAGKEIDNEVQAQAEAGVEYGDE